MIRILFFIEELIGGGAEKVLCNLVNEMDQSRFDITVQTLWKADPNGFLRPGIRYRYCYAERTRASILRSRVEAALGLTGRLYIHGNYDIQVAYLEFGATKILSRAPRRHAKKVAWVHSDLERKLNGNQKAIQKATAQYRSYDRIVCVSETVKTSFVKLFGREGDVYVLYNTIDDQTVREKAEAILPSFPEKKRLTVVAVGRLSEEKRYDMLLHIHKNLLDEGLEHDLWIVGKGDQREKLQSIIDHNGLSDSVTLCGYQPNPYPYMNAADLLVCSSRYEGFSTFVTEGLILGKPIVTTDCSGMRELLGNSEYGLIVDNSESALKDGLRQMLTDKSFRSYIANSAKNKGKDFSSKMLTVQAERFFEKLGE